jgi:parvulin-like peptidyl-prolyl isomerase
LILRELQLQDAVAKGLKADKQLVKKQIAAIKDRYPSKKEYKAALEQAGLNEDTLKKEVEKVVLVQTVIAKTVQDPSVVTEAALKEYYEKNKDKFREPESIRLRLISTKEESKAREAIKLIKAGEDFGTVAGRMSEDNYRIKGGDIGFIHRGRVLQEIEEVAFKLKTGEMSGLIKGTGNWFVIRAEDKQPEHQKSFDEIKGKLKKELETRKSQELMDQWTTEMKTKAKIELIDTEKK